MINFAGNFITGRLPPVKILDQLQDPQKEVIKSWSEKQTATLSCVQAQLLKRVNTAQAQPKYGNNGILTASQLLQQIWQLIGSLAAQTNL